MCMFRNCTGPFCVENRYHPSSPTSHKCPRPLLLSQLYTTTWSMLNCVLSDHHILITIGPQIMGMVLLHDIVQGKKRSFCRKTHEHITGFQGGDTTSRQNEEMRAGNGWPTPQQSTYLNSQYPNSHIPFSLTNPHPRPLFSVPFRAYHLHIAPCPPASKGLHFLHSSFAAPPSLFLFFLNKWHCQFNKVPKTTFNCN